MDGVDPNLLSTPLLLLSIISPIFPFKEFFKAFYAMRALRFQLLIVHCYRSWIAFGLFGLKIYLRS
jgi:hypothetical protein